MAQPGKFFVSYRREDSQHLAGRLFDRLEAKFGSSNIFMDVDSITPGLDFAQVINEAVRGCDVLIALIGPSWQTMTNRQGRRRLEDPDDLVRLEIFAALERGIPVIPLLGDGATMPTRDELPQELGSLASRHWARLAHATFNADIQLLIEALNRLVDRPPPPPATESTSPSVDRPGASAAETDTGSTERGRSPGEEASPVGLSLDDVRNKRFRMARKSGYEVLEVDEFVDQIEETFERMFEDVMRRRNGEPVTGPSPSTLTLDDVRNKRFRMARKSGYEVLEVDDFVDAVERTFALLGKELT